MYQHVAPRLASSAERVEQYRADLAAMADGLDGKRWGVEVHGPIRDMDGHLAAVAGIYRDLAAQMQQQGDNVSDAHDAHPWVPDNLLGEEYPTFTTAGSPVMADAAAPTSADTAQPDFAAIAARLREIDTEDEGRAFLDAQNLDKQGLLAVAAALGLSRLERKSAAEIKRRIIRQAIGARRKFQGLREGWQRRPETDAEPTVTYTTPEVSRNEFDDYRPGKGLDSVQDTVADLLGTYLATEVNPITTPTGVKFEVTGARRHIEQLAGLYGETLPSASAAEEVPVSGAKPSRLPRGELKVVKALPPGKRAAVDLVQDADGRVAIRKIFHHDPDDMIRADREVAAAAVANAVGITDLEVRRVDPDTVLMTYFEGKTGTDLAYATMSPEDVALLDDDAVTEEQYDDPEWLARWEKADDEYRANLKPWMRAPGAKEIGLFDYLALNIDRNSSNWIVDDDGVVHPIDHDASFIGSIQQQDGLVDFDSPFMRAWLAKDDVGGHRRPDALVSPFSRSELEQVMERLEDAKPALDKIPPVRGVGTYDLVRQRLEWLIEACDATA